MSFAECKSLHTGIELMQEADIQSAESPHKIMKIIIISAKGYVLFVSYLHARLISQTALLACSK